MQATLNRAEIFANDTKLRLLGGQLKRAVFAPAVLNHLGDVGKTLAALRTAPAAAEHFGDGSGVGARSRKLPVLQRVTDAHIHGSTGRFLAGAPSRDRFATLAQLIMIVNNRADGPDPGGTAPSMAREAVEGIGECRHSRPAPPCGAGEKRIP